MKVHKQSPSELYDYPLNWVDTLAQGENITGSEWIVPSDLTKVAATIDGTFTCVWLTGGVDGNTYHVLNRITTSVGRVSETVFALQIESKV